MTTNATGNRRHSEDELQKCIFCKVVKKEIPASIIFEDAQVVAFLDINPVNPGHALIVPKEHHVDILETPDSVASQMLLHVKKIAPSIVSAVKADGFNIGINTKPAAGQVIFHTHLHIIPRFSTDGLKHWPHKQLPKEDMARVQAAIKAQLAK